MRSNKLLTEEIGNARSDGFASRISGSEMSEPLILGMQANGYERKSTGSIASARMPRVCAGRMRSGAAMITCAAMRSGNWRARRSASRPPIEKPTR